MPRALAVLSGLAVAAASLGTARADPAATAATTAATPAPPGPPGFAIGPASTWILLGGITTGGTVALADKGYFIGGEVSLALLREGDHVGFYTDGYYDWGANGTYVTGGIELGHKVIGVDGGIAVRMANGDRTIGFAGRASLGLGVVSVFARYLHFPRGIGEMAIPDDNVIQVGLELKLPLTTVIGN